MPTDCGPDRPLPLDNRASSSHTARTLVLVDSLPYPELLGSQFGGTPMADEAAATTSGPPAPRAWGVYGARSEVGALNNIAAQTILDAIGEVRLGQVHALGIPIFDPRGDPVSPDRPRALHVVYRDFSHYRSGICHPLPGGVGSVDDGIFISCHGTTHIDALGHIFVQGQMWDGRDAELATPGLRWASVAAVAARGIVARGVLIDVAGDEGVDHLDRQRHVTLADLLRVLDREEVAVQPGDIILLRTGSLARFYDSGAEAFFDQYSEPGLSYELDLLEWFRDNRLAGLGSDTLSNELPVAPTIDAGYPLHRFLLRDLGVTFHEALWLEDLAAACRADARYTGLYVASPLKLTGASGSPVNPLFIK